LATSCSERAWKWNYIALKLNAYPFPLSDFHFIVVNSPSAYKEWPLSNNLESILTALTVTSRGFGTHVAGLCTTSFGIFIGDYSVPVAQTPVFQSFPISS